MTVTALLSTLVAVLTGVITVDKFLHAFGLSKLIAAQVRHSADGLVAKAKLTPDTKDDEVAASLERVAHLAADAYENGDTAGALAQVKAFAEKRVAPKA